MRNQSLQEGLPYVSVSDYISTAGGDASVGIQKAIDENPNRTLFFPDGKYIIEKPIMTPADPQKSVTLLLSNYAVIRAAKDWRCEECMIRLGALCPSRDIYHCGSNYSFSGGILDGSGVASCLSVESGRETKIFDTSIKNAKIGIHIKHGANNGSSDADIFGVNIIGNGTAESIGVLVEGYDNTLSNIRIAKTFIGVKLLSGGNMLRSIHPLYTSDYTDYSESCGFFVAHNENWFDFCYSDQFATGFRTAYNAGSNVFHHCYCYWYSEKQGTHTAFRADGKFDAVVTDFRL